MASLPLRQAVRQVLTQAQLRARLHELETVAHATVPHDVRGAAAVAKADADQLAAERAAEGEEAAEGE